jgi:hypothetical protein
MRLKKLKMQQQVFRSLNPGVSMSKELRHDAAAKTQDAVERIQKPESRSQQKQKAETRI